MQCGHTCTITMSESCRVPRGDYSEGYMSIIYKGKNPCHNLPDWQMDGNQTISIEICECPCSLWLSFGYIHCVSVVCPLVFGKWFVPFHTGTTTDKNIICPVLSVISIRFSVTGALGRCMDTAAAPCLVGYAPQLINTGSGPCTQHGVLATSGPLA